MCLIGMLLFAATGLTLNNATHIEASPQVVTRDARLPAAMVASLAGAGNSKAAELPGPVADWIGHELALDLRHKDGEWSSDEVYIALPRPGGDAWVRIDRRSGEIEYEKTDRGWMSYLNDLHKGRNTGPAWSWFIDIFAVACLVFSITGLLILKMHAANRALTWPLVGLGLVIPLLLAMIFIH